MELRVYQKVLMWIALSVVIVTGQINFGEERRNHQVKQLPRNQLVSVARLSNYRQFMKRILKPILRERVAGTAGNVAVQRHIKSWMANLGWHIEEDRFEDTTPLGVKEFNNIIATHDINARRFLVLACHFDSKYFPNFEFIGATDSAVPCAMMMSLAQTLNNKLDRKGSQADGVSLQLIFFDGEEAFKTWRASDSLYGSRHLAAKWENTPHPHDPNSNRLKGIDAFVLLDLIGAVNPTFRNFFPQMTGDLFQELRQIEADLHDAKKLRRHSRRNQYFSSNGGGAQVEDDHVPFLQRGVPILHLISYPFPEVWHSPEDNASAIDQNTVKNLNKIFRVFVAKYLHLIV